MKETRDTGRGSTFEEVGAGSQPTFPDTFPADPPTGTNGREQGYGYGDGYYDGSGYQAPVYVSDENFRASYRELFGDLNPAFLPVNSGTQGFSGSAAILPSGHASGSAHPTMFTQRAPRPTGARADPNRIPTDPRQARHERRGGNTSGRIDRIRSRGRRSRVARNSRGSNRARRSFRSCSRPRRSRRSRSGRKGRGSRRKSNSVRHAQNSQVNRSDNSLARAGYVPDKKKFPTITVL